MKALLITLLSACLIFNALSVQIQQQPDKEETPIAMKTALRTNEVESFLPMETETEYMENSEGLAKGVKSSLGNVNEPTEHTSDEMTKDIKQGPIEFDFPSSDRAGSDSELIDTKVNSNQGLEDSEIADTVNGANNEENGEILDEMNEAEAETEIKENELAKNGMTGLEPETNIMINEMDENEPMPYVILGPDFVAGINVMDNLFETETETGGNDIAGDMAETETESELKANGIKDNRIMAGVTDSETETESETGNTMDELARAETDIESEAEDENKAEDSEKTNENN